MCWGRISMTTRRSSPRLLVFVAWITVLVSVSCGPPRSATGLTITDSAGVTIVESAAATWMSGEEWSLGTEPTLEMGEVDGSPAHQFDGIAGIRTLSDGRIVVANGGSGEIRVFSQVGEILRTLGGSGEGPGEFTNLSGIDLMARDSILALDYGSRRGKIFHPDPGFVRSFELAVEGFGGVEAVRSLGDGSLVAITQSPMRPGETGIYRDPIAMARLDASGSLVKVIGVFPGSAIAIFPGGLGSPPHRSNTVHAVFDETLYVGTQETFEIRAYDPEGTLLRIVRAPTPDLSLTEDDVRSYVDNILGQQNAPEAVKATFLETYLTQIPWPPTRPAYSELLSDALGNLWVGEPRSGPYQDPVWWTVFSPEGALMGRVELPDRFRPFEIGADYVLGRWQGPLDVEYVHLYELVKP